MTCKLLTLPWYLTLMSFNILTLKMCLLELPKKQRISKIRQKHHIHLKDWLKTPA